VKILRKSSRLIELIRVPDYRIILGAVLLIFTISANIAWLNPNPDYVIKTHPKIPILWQYNGDAVVEFLSAAYFPEYYRIDKTRINRPGYPALAHTLGRVFGVLAFPIYRMDPLTQGLLGYMTLKLLIYLSGAFAFYYLVRRWFERRVALLAVLLLLLHPFAVIFSTTFHTSELQFITPIILLALWFKLGDLYSHKNNIVFSLLAGLLMLAKQNYAIYLAILAFSFFVLKRYKESILSFLVHLVPLGIWMFALKMLGIPYYNHESANGLGVWLYQDLIFRNPLEIVQTVLGSVNLWLSALIGHFSLLVPAALAALVIVSARHAFSRNYYLFAGFFTFFSWLQTFAANRYNSYMTSDLSIIIFPLAAYAIWAILEKYKLTRWQTAFLALYFLIGLTTIMEFPWIHPYNQTNVINDDRVMELKSGDL
jgi:hypothetical protein